MNPFKCVGNACKRVGSAIGRTAVHAVASIPTEENRDREFIKTSIAALSPQARQFYREAFVQGAVDENGKINNENMRHIGMFEAGYPFPEGPINVNAVEEELRGRGLISIPRNWARRMGNRFLQEHSIFTTLHQQARGLAREWGMREENGPFLPNAVHSERQATPYRDDPVEAARLAREYAARRAAVKAEAERRAAPGQGRNLAQVRMLGEAKQLPFPLDAHIGSFITGVEGPMEHQVNVLKGRVGYQGPLRPVGRPVEVSSYETLNRTRRRRAKRSQRKSRKMQKH